MIASLIVVPTIPQDIAISAVKEKDIEAKLKTVRKKKKKKDRKKA